MKKCLMAIALMSCVMIPCITNAIRTNGITQAEWDNSTENDWYNASCNETDEVYVYANDYGLYLDYFKNPAGNKNPFVIQSWRVLHRDAGNNEYIVTNKSKYQKNGKNDVGMTIANRDVLAPDWKVAPGHEIRHMTTAEEVNGATFEYNWSFVNPVYINGKKFTVPNYRSNGNHPSNPTYFPNWDAEFRTITLYDEDDDLDSARDNKVIVECQKMVIRRCGDGIKDPREACDPGMTQPKGWTCDAECKQHIIPEPKCKSQYNGQRVANLTEGPHLCEEGTYSDFHYNSDTHTWTWKCNNTAGVDTGCSAIKPYCGDGIKDAGEDCDPGSAGTATMSDGRICNSNCKIEDAPTLGTLKTTKTLKSSRYVSYTGEEMEWTITVTAVGGNVKDVVIEDRLPQELSYVTYTKESVPSGITIDSNQPTITNNGKTITWKPNGTLKKNESIVLVIKTKVVKMPNRSGSQNIACAWAPGLEEDCSNPQIPGRLEPDKKIIGSGEITATGDIVEWSLKVTAVGGDVTDFVIEDTLPRVLGYKDYKVLNNAGLQIGAPTKGTITSGGKELETVKWTINGKLEKGKYVEIKLITYAKVMPDRKYNNVLCVRPKDKPDKKDCDPEPIGPSCNSKYHGQTLSSLDKNSDLCIGGTVGNFKFNTSENKWTWTCDNEAGTRDCYAFKETASKGKVKPDKILKTTEITSVGQKVEWELTATAVGGYVENVTIRDYLPNILSYDSIKSVDLPTGVTLLNREPRKDSDSTGKYVEWQTSGRLNQGDSIKLVIYTKVDQMPETGKKYKNVECATTGNKTEWICDPEPLSGQCESDYAGKELDTLTKGNHLCKVGQLTSFTETSTGWTWTCDNYESIANCSANKKTSKGGLKIEKVLRTKTGVNKGDRLEWRIYVTADNGSVENVTIRDYLPNILSYVGMNENVTSLPSGVNMVDSNQPTEGSDSTGKYVQWKTTGTLTKGSQIVLAIYTNVDEMPEPGKEYRNVACATTGNNTDWICDTAPIEGKCESKYAGQIFTELTESNDLCKVGKVGNFKLNTGENKWTWTCNSYSSSKECFAYRETGTGYLEVTKTLISSNKYVTGLDQELVWDIVVTAKNGSVEMKYIKDILPRELKYKTFKKINTSGIKIVDEPELSENGKVITWKAKGTLEKGKSIKLRLYTTVVEVPEYEIENVACAAGPEELCGSGSTSSLRIEKSIWDGKKGVQSITGNEGEDITYVINFGNYGNTGTYVMLKDFLPKDLQVKSSDITIKGGRYSTGFGGESENPYRGRWESVQGVYINIYSGIYLGPKASGTMTIVGTALKSEDDLHNRTNFACIYDNEGNKVACDDAVYNVEEEKEVQCEDLDGMSSSETVTVEDKNEKVERNVTCKASGKADITIDCGNGDSTTEKGVKSLNKTCTFKGLDTYEVICTVKNDRSKSICQKSLTIEEKRNPNPPRTPVCRDMKIDTDNKTVTCYANKPVYFKVNGCSTDYKFNESDEKSSMWKFKCKDNIDLKNIQCAVGDNKNDFERDNETKTCSIGSYESLSQTQECFNVNGGNFSIEEGEILPFYWNLKKIVDTVGNSSYTEINENYEDAKEKVDSNKYKGETCKKPGAIATDSMVCTFGIYDAGNYVKKYDDENGEIKKPLYKLRGPCLTNSTGMNKKLLEARYDTMIGRYCAKDECLSFQLPLKEGDSPDDRGDTNGFGDLLYSSVYYIEKFGIGGKDTVHLGTYADGDRGLVAASEGQDKKSYGEYKISLERIEYLACEGDDDDKSHWEYHEVDNVVCEGNFAISNPYTIQKTPSGNLTASTTELSNYRTMNGDEIFKKAVENISTTDYHKNDNVQNAMDNFINKYEKLAVKVSGVSKFGGENVSNLRKVPGKDIYFIDGDITVKGGTTINKPFTLVQTSGKTTVKGDVNYNMMLLTKGDIVFQGNCTSDQKVKGIYYASGSLIRQGVKKNTEDRLNETTWCTNGGLHVQGVLIGNGFENLVRKSRSNLNKWFDSTTDKKKTIMNGASVLIEYSPSIFTKSTMPPGAEDFTTALSIYKQ